VIVGNKEIAARFVLHPDEIFERSEVVAQMQLTGRANPAKYCIHFVFL
jgi:hypothetical protein